MRAAAALLDVLLDGVAVARPVRKGEQDVEDRERERFTGGLGLLLRHNISLDDTSA